MIEPLINFNIITRHSMPPDAEMTGSVTHHPGNTFATFFSKKQTNNNKKTPELHCIKPQELINSL